jgi:hypothetical protein
MHAGRIRRAVAQEQQRSAERDRRTADRAGGAAGGSGASGGDGWAVESGAGRDRR